jgi:homoserine O-acetyltransferase
VHALNAVAADVSFAEIVSNAGHDAFLLDEPDFRRVLGGFLAGCAQRRGLNGRARPAPAR